MMALRALGLLGIVVGGGILGVSTRGLAQQSPPPDCQTQLGLAMQRMGTQQSLASQDREALILYFQAELRKYMQERDTALKERDDARQQLENGAKSPEKEKP